MIVMAVREGCPTMPRWFRLVPYNVQAIKILNEDDVARAVTWAGGASSTTDLAVYVPTAEGTLRIGQGEYLVRNLDGKFKKMTEYEFEVKGQAQLI